MSQLHFNSIKTTDVSLGWAQAFLKTRAAVKQEVIPLLLTINDIDSDTPIETPRIRQLLDDDLVSKSLPSSATVASTIFPISMWNSKLPRHALFKRYKDALPQLKKCAQNRNGIYFERLIAYGKNDYNQLDFFLDSRNKTGNRRRSVLQAVIVEPEKDQTNQRMRGFPCMQHVSFAPFGRDELAVNGFYGTQYIYQKAYGNYLGLINLGRFVAHELGRRLTQANCFTGIAQLGTNKKETAELAFELEKLVGEYNFE